MENGSIKWFDATKGFGFVVPQDGSKDIYVHANALEKAGLVTLEQGSVVTYTIGGKVGKTFVETITLVSAPPSLPSNVYVPRAQANRVELDAEEEFEREWGLRRA